ncbi:hypothetical protein MMC08_008460 [Hypocenomyce scalaris]|nr:hypothetical protein [Hypocenomyce scalaris]
MSTHEDGREYDVVLAGGGTAACIIAGRLAQADPSLSILIIEGGKNNLNDPLVTNPAMYLAHLVPDSQTALFYKANPSDALAGREAIVPCGGILGGGSSINFTMYTRAQGCDFDDWKTEGWDYKSMLPFSKKLETYHFDDAAIDKSLHGYNGPINISRGTYNPKGPEDDVMKAAEASGYPEIRDLQDFTSVGGFSRWARYVGPDGTRQDTAHRYVHPLMADGNHPNLHLLLESKVVRVVFDENKRATGVDAKKLVVVSAGALGTPSVLERSGVGNKEILEKLDIEVVSNLPGVGENYQDHHLLLYPYKTNLKPEDTIDPILDGRMDFVKANKERNPRLGWNAIDVCSKLRPTEEEVDELGNEFRNLWDRDFKHRKERPLMLMGVISSFLGDHSILPEPHQQYATMGTYTAYPYARGNIHIVSKSASTPASFNTGFLDHDADLKKQLWAYKKQREIYRRTNAYQGELELGHPKFPEGSKAALVDGGKKGGFKDMEERMAMKNIEYSAEDDKAIEDWIRQNLNTTWHSMGTCKMAPRNEGGVVDKDLKVYGTTGLKLADLSIAPGNVAANTNNTALMVGEKAADIIMKELGLHIQGQSGDWLQLSTEPTQANLSVM